MMRFRLQMPVRRMATIATSDLKPIDLYRVMTSAIVPRPIAFVSTRNEDGSTNVAPYSFFMGVSSNPPVVCFSVTSSSKPEKSVKDSLRNVLREKRFVVNSSQIDFGADLNSCSKEIDYGVSELEGTALSSSDKNNSIEQSMWHFDCVLRETVQVGTLGDVGAATVVFGTIEKIFIDDTVLKDESDRRNGWLDFAKLKPLARLSGNLYCGLGEIFKMVRPKSK